ASAASACQDGASPVLTFTGSGGTAPYTFNYTINGTAYTLTTTTGDSATANIDTSVAGSQSVILTGVSDASCSNVQNDALTVTIQGLPTATMVADVTAVCQNGTSPVITFTGAGGTSPYTFTYTVDGGTPLTISTATGSDSVTLSVPTGTVGISTYELTGVAEGGADACSQTQTGTVSITVNPLPTATVTVDAASVCQGGASPVVTFTGAGGIAPYTFTYTLNGSSQTAV
ncbi:adhesin, partial [Flavobacterium sp. MAH-1]|nr:adhesin [Flavobacterium agri]NYA72797.1 adhesin [Flavobacterium agri]